MGKCGIIGETRILSQECEEAECEWKIPQFSSLSSTVGANYFSPKVRIWNTVWIMRIFPNGTPKRPNWIKFELGKSNLEKGVYFSLCIKSVYGWEKKKLHLEPFNAFAYICSLRKFLPVRSQITYSYTLRVKLSIYRGNRLSDLDLSEAGRINKEAGIEYIFFYSKDDWDLSDVDNPTTSRAGEDDRLDSKGDWDLSDVDNPTTSRAGEEDRLDSKAKRCVSRETQTKESPDAVCGETAGDTKAQTHDTCEPQRKVAKRRREEIEVLDETIRVLREKVRKLGTNGDSPLRIHLQNLLLTGDDHDVILKVKDQEFKAHKCILRSRSPTFAAMFTHEIGDGPILLEDCDPESFGDFLKYIYTEKVVDLSANKAMGLYYMADKYFIWDLKEKCVQYLKTELSSTVVCDVISLATIHGENDLRDCAVNFFSNNVEEIITTVEWQRFGEKNFGAANELYIKALERKKEMKAT